MSEFKISFILIAYNHERFIREAIQGALSQEGQPMEIILSDDASHDGTYRIMEEIAGTYEGPHVLRLNRNSRNLGLVAHLQHAVNLSTGQWIVAAAGDDISLPGRSAAVLRAAKNSEGVVAVGVGCQLMTESGVIKFGRTMQISAEPLAASPFQALVQLRRGGRKKVLTGAVMAWHRSVFEKFPSFPPARNLYEDIILQWRARLLGAVASVPEPLVYYRSHPNSMTNWGPGADCEAARVGKARLLQSVKASWQAVRADFEHAARSGFLRHDQARLCCVEINRQIEYVNALIEWPQAPLSRRIAFFVRYFNYGIWRHVMPRLASMISC